METKTMAETDFFSLSNYIIDEKISAFKFTNAYKVYDSNGMQIGTVEQQKVSGGAKAARMLLGSGAKAVQSFQLDIKDINGNTLASVQRGGLGSGIRTINILDGGGSTLGTIKIVFSMWAPKQEILSPSGEVIGRIQGDWKGWNFEIKDVRDNVFGTINKKWNGAMKEIFTTADKYLVTISEDVEKLYRIAIVATAITIDMVLKESK